jgi:hypothetical protein
MTIVWENVLIAVVFLVGIGLVLRAIFRNNSRR